MPNSNKEKINIEKELSELGISEKEKKLMKGTLNYKKNIPFIVIIVFAVCHQWIRYYDILRQDVFFLIFTSIFYVALIWASIWTYFYQKKISATFIKIVLKRNKDKKEEGGDR